MIRYSGLSTSCFALSSTGIVLLTQSLQTALDLSVWFGGLLDGALSGPRPMQMLWRLPYGPSQPMHYKVQLICSGSSFSLGLSLIVRGGPSTPLLLLDVPHAGHPMQLQVEVVEESSSWSVISIARYLARYLHLSGSSTYVRVSQSKPQCARGPCRAARPSSEIPRTEPLYLEEEISSAYSTRPRSIERAAKECRYLLRIGLHCGRSFCRCLPCDLPSNLVSGRNNGYSAFD